MKDSYFGISIYFFLSFLNLLDEIGPSQSRSKVILELNFIQRSKRTFPLLKTIQLLNSPSGIATNSF